MQRQKYKRGKNKSFGSGDSALIALAIAAVLFVCYVVMVKFDVISNFDQDTFKPKQDDVPVADFDGACVHFIDVGQGDSELIVADDGTTMLIDAGESDSGITVLRYLRDLGITRLDYVVGTHPHSDHIGGLRDVLNSELEVGTVITPTIPEGLEPTTKSYERFIAAIARKGCAVQDVKNESFAFGSGTITIIKPDYILDNYNNYSPYILFKYGNTTFLFTGDAEKVIEKQMINREELIDADVLKVAHHGSSTSSCYDFLDAVTPEYCVIECGDSSYNHPNPDTVSRLLEYTDKIYRTDHYGSIVFRCDKNSFTVETERTP